MTSLVAPVVLAAGAALVLSMPLIALKEILMRRSRKNFKKHLGRRRICRVNFEEVDSVAKDTGRASKNVEVVQVSYGSGIKRKFLPSAPPGYDELFSPPPPYSTN